MSDESIKKDKVKFRLGGKMRVRFSAMVIAVLVGFGAGYITCSFKPWEKIAPVITKADSTITNNNYVLTISAIEKVVKPASDLITTKYNYKDADTYENYKQFFGKKIPFTTDKVVFTYKGTIGVGINLSEVIYKIDNDNKTINIQLPEIGIKSNEIDDSSFQYLFESNSVFNATGMSDYTQLLATLKQKQEEEVKGDADFMNTAKQNTENVLKDFLTASDETRDYTVTFE